MKYLVAEQAQDGWNVKVITTHILKDLTEVKALARYGGLRNGKTVQNEIFIRPLL